MAKTNNSKKLVSAAAVAALLAMHGAVADPLVDAQRLVATNLLLQSYPAHFTKSERDYGYEQQGDAEVAFGFKVKPWGLDQTLLALGELNPGAEPEQYVSVYGGSVFDSGRNRFSIPVSRQQLVLDEGTPLKLNALGLEWHHQVDEHNLLNVSAQYADYHYEATNARNAVGLLASVGWSGRYAGDTGPRVGGSLFLGEESVADDAYRYFGRRYYGLTLDGSLSLFKDHSPFLSLKLQWSNYSDADPVYMANRIEDYSRLAAGWDWRIQPNWRLRAEADFTTNQSNLSPYQYDRNRLFFTTQFDFR